MIKFYLFIEYVYNAGVAQLVEHLLAKQKVASSNLVSRFFCVPVAQLDRATDF